MKKRLLVLPVLFLVSYLSFSQGVGIGTTSPDASAALDITHLTKGLLIPRLSTPAILAIPIPAKGLLVYDSLTNRLMVNTGTPAAPDWQPVAGSNSGSGWILNGNNGVQGNQFIGTLNNAPLRFRANNIEAGELNPVNGSVFWGLRAGLLNGTNHSNIAIGTDALTSNTRVSNLVAIGDSALFHNNNGIVNITDGTNNTAIGSKTLFSNTIGNNNTATGFNSLFSNTIGGVNDAHGSNALFNNTTGSLNAAFGSNALLSNTTGRFNTAIGAGSLSSNTNSDASTAIGSLTLAANTTGHDNTAAGFQALFFNTTGSDNIGIGVQSLFFNATGSQNTAVGDHALGANDVGGSNTAIGFGADVNAGNLFNATAIGQGAIVDASNKIRLGNGAVTVIEGQVPFTTPSDGRFKYEVKEDVKGLDFIMQLRPVTYRFNVQQFDEQQKQGKDNIPAVASSYITQAAYDEAAAIRRTGFIAQEVEKAANTSGYNFSGIIKPKTDKEHYSLSYESFVVPLVKAMQEQQQTIEALKKQNADLEKRLQALEKK